MPSHQPFRFRLIVFTALFTLLAPSTMSFAGESIDLFNGADLTGWNLYSPAADADLTKTWFVKDGVICCTGNPAGFIETRSEYANYRLTFEWRWPEEGGNSGVLNHICSPGGEYFETWPKCLEVQLGHNDAGDFWVIGTDFKEHTGGEDRRVPKQKPSNEKPLGEWNRGEVVCEGDKVTVSINGELQNVANEVTVQKGRIGFQSEGTPIEFRAIRIESLEPEKQTAKGVVYEDSNDNGVRDSGEKGIAGVLVTNQREVAKTDDSGHYSLEVDSDDILSVIKPSGYRFHLDELFLPRFSYIHKPLGSKPSKFPGVAPTGPLPESVDFGLIPDPDEKKFDVILFGDPQPTDYAEVQFIRDDVIAEMIDEPIVRASNFGVSLGDVMNNDLSLYDPYNKVIAQLEKPWYNVIGNHDLNFDSPVDTYSDETWHRVYGPNYYAFFEGEVLFLALDNVHWKIEDRKNPETGQIEKKGGYIALFGQDQLAWIASVLEHQPKDRLSVLMMHIPLAREWGNDTEDVQELYPLLKDRKVLAVAGHTHTQEHVFIGKEHSEVLDGVEIHHLINVTVCGAWWKGIRDERGIPIAITQDGVENGYTVLSIDNHAYTTKFKASGKPWDYQIRIVSPIGHLKGGERVIANVQAGSSKSEVAYRIDDGELVAMTRERMPDPLVKELFEKRKEPRYKDAIWKDAQAPTDRNTHIWAADLPEGLPAGTHTLTVVEKDQWGRTHRASSIFVVE